MLARDVMTSDPAVCTPEATLVDVSRLMVQFHCGAIPVVDSPQTKTLLGIVTDRDLVCRALAEGKNPQTPIKECMTAKPTTVHPDDALETCCRYMEDRQVRRLPVIDLDGRLLGIIAQADIVEHAPANVSAKLLEEISQPTEEASRTAAIAA